MMSKPGWAHSCFQNLVLFVSLASRAHFGMFAEGGGSNPRITSLGGIGSLAAGRIDNLIAGRRHDLPVVGVLRIVGTSVAVMISSSSCSHLHLLLMYQVIMVVSPTALLFVSVNLRINGLSRPHLENGQVVKT